MPFCQLSPSPSNGFAASSTRHFRTRGGGWSIYSLASYLFHTYDLLLYL